MFTGIIEEVGTLLERQETGLLIRAAYILEDLAVKESVAVDGVCLTVTERGKDWFRVDTMPETLRRTRLGSLQPGAFLNLERSLAANGRIGGHIVQGHVEATAPVRALRQDGIGLEVEIGLPTQLAPSVISKGFIAINGVSLTVVECQADYFSIALIPYTREHTNLFQYPETDRKGETLASPLTHGDRDDVTRSTPDRPDDISRGQLQIGSLLNLESDIVGRTIAHFAEQYTRSN